MPKTYFYQSGSLPGVGMFPAGVVVTTDDTTGAVISVKASLATPPIDPQPTPVAIDTPLQSSSRQAKALATPPALSPKDGD